LKRSGSTIKFSATATLIDEDAEAEKVFQIVGETGADVKAATSPSLRRRRGC
jgi:transcription elongation factor GreA